MNNLINLLDFEFRSLRVSELACLPLPGGCESGVRVVRGNCRPRCCSVTATLIDIRERTAYGTIPLPFLSLMMTSRCRRAGDFSKNCTAGRVITIPMHCDTIAVRRGWGSRHFASQTFSAQKALLFCRDCSATRAGAWPGSAAGGKSPHCAQPSTAGVDHTVARTRHTPNLTCLFYLC
jgi:hypothetical protein